MTNRYKDEVSVTGRSAHSYHLESANTVHTIQPLVHNHFHNSCSHVADNQHTDSRRV